MRDRFIRGAIAGIVGALASILVSIVLTMVLKMGSIHFYDVSGMILYGRRPHGLLETLFAEIGHFSVSAGIGVMFSYLVPLFTSRFYLVKGVAFGIGTWFAVHLASSFFRVPLITRMSVGSLFAQFIASCVYGVVMALTLRWIDNALYKRSRSD